MSKSFGATLAGWKAPRHPDAMLLEGRYARLERLDAGAHAQGLFEANSGHDALWDYLPYGPFATATEYAVWVRGNAALTDPRFYAIRDLGTGQLGGVASYLRIAPEMGTIELGHINLAPRLQRGRAASEAMMLMIGWAFGAGYRRFEWKCDALNLPSRRAAERLGLSYEGIFRQAAVVKGRNRDTAWYAATDGDWPALQTAYEAWLRPANFGASGAQIARLSGLTAPMLVARDPALNG